MARSVRQAAVACLAVLLVLAAQVHEAVAPPPALPTCEGTKGHVTISADELGVTWEGWGTSLAWWANWAGGLSSKDQARILDLVFSRKKGLGLNIVRYEIGSGNQSPKDARFQKPPATFKVTPAFKLSAKAPYDWSRGEHQRNILLGAKKRGVNRFEAFANSPPGWMTISGDYAGNKNIGQSNLAPSNYGVFADYLTEVVREYRDNPKWNITFKTLEPFNEPFEGHWLEGGPQPGCNFNGPQINALVMVVQKALQQKGLKTVIGGVDSWAAHTPTIFKSFSPSARKALDRFNVHGYSNKQQPNTITYRQHMARLASENNKKVMMSEWGPADDYGSEMDIALNLAREIQLDINVMLVVGWSYWQAVEEFIGEPYWGLIYAPFKYNKPPKFVLRKQFFVMQQFSRWVVPGSLPMDVHVGCKHGILVTYHPQLKRLTVVASSYVNRLQRMVLDISSQYSEGQGGTKLRTFRTSQLENYRKLGTAQVSIPGAVRVNLRPHSVTTFVFQNVLRR